MKIGIDASLLVRKEIGGTGRFLTNLLKHILELDKTNQYFLFAPCRLENYTAKGFSVITTKENKIIPSQYYFPFWLNFVLPKELKKNKIDVFFQINLFLPLFCNYKEIKFITTIHDAIPKINPHYRDFLYRIYSNIFLPFSIRKSQAIITVSNNSKKDLINFYNIPQNKIRVIYEAADERFKPKKLSQEEKRKIFSKYNLSGDFILYVGAIDNRKNITGILKIGDLIRNSGKNIKIVLVGKLGFNSKKIMKEVKKRNYVIHLDNVGDEDLPCFYNLAKALLFPSFYEGFGLPSLEAMQSGLPILASNTSSLGEIVNEGGITHHPEDHESFARDIIKLLDDDAFFQEMRDKAILRAAEFNWAESTNKLIDIFNKI